MSDLISRKRLVIELSAQIAVGALTEEVALDILDHSPRVEPKTDVLDKIRAEIAEYKDDKIIHDERNEMIDIILEIIDKHISGMAESEEK